MKRIVYQRSDGGLSVVHPFEGARLALAVTVDGVTRSSECPQTVDSFYRRWPVAGAVVDWAETEDEFVSRLAEKEAAKGRTPIIVEEVGVPTDRTFRDAWQLSGTKIEHNMEKCRSIHRQRLRALRAPLLAALDVEWMQATEQGKSTVEIVAKKQALRDCTAYAPIEAATTPEELHVAVPPVLST